MAGKTTVMREVAIIQFLAQVGSFVPAQSAQLHLCDALFSRLGASDDIMRGQSTFMVEMAEMAEILRHATADSLIIVDEVGRGTSTYDGLSIAWSLVEYLVKDLRALTLFSTHYHELIDVVYHQKGAKNYSVATSVHGGDVQFLYRLEEKGAEESYGIYVAKLAGLPFNVLKRSEEILLDLESKQHKQEKTVSVVPYQNQYNKLESDLASLDILNMTPLQAMEKLYQLKKSANI
jgi:DNA mismatch repair protein MutS